MPKLILSLDGIIVKEVHLRKVRATIGRRPYNDIVIENLAVSGEHAVIQDTGHQIVLKDLGSTNGTYVNGQPIRKQALEYGDLIEIGRYKIQYVESTGNTAPGDLNKVNGSAAVSDGGNPAVPTQPAALPATPPTLEGDAIEGPRLRVLNGASSNKSMALTKVVSTIGKPGVSVASVIRRGDGCYDLAHVTGEMVATVNGVSAAQGSIALNHGDHIDVGGVQLEFLDH
ncbi:MAG: FHA domain-containing protein [Burkholderiaceae bacterium]|jgi:predicted component of type VI protein secretion system|nr:FHA domain-containing protein [Burkholderiaceae bacterium]